MGSTDSSLSRHPFLDFRKIASGFAHKHIPSPFGQAAFRAAVGLWSRIFGVDERQRLVLDAMEAGRDGFWHANWIFKSLFYPEISATLLLEHDGECDPAARTARLLSGAMRFRQRFQRGEMPPEFAAGRPLDMRRYAYFFSRMTRTHLERGKLRHEIVDVEPTDYVICWIRGTAFRIIVLDKAGEPLAASLIEASLRAAIRAGAAAPAALGLLTTLSTRKSARMLRDFWVQNAVSRALIDNAILSASIDLDAAPIGLEATFRAIHAENFGNRDFRKSLQIVVTGNGHAGIYVNPHAGLGGTLSARLCSDLHRFAAASETFAGGEAGPAPERIDLVWRPSRSDRKDYRHLERAIGARMYPKKTLSTLAFPGTGQAAFSAAGISADAAFHCALTLAFYRAFERLPVIGNFVNLRALEHGDIWRYNGTPEAMRRFALRPGPDTLADALASHRALVKEVKRGDDEFYLGAMLLKKLINDGDVSFYSFVTLLLLCQVFVRDFSRRFMAPDIWVSGIPALTGIWMTGRPATTMSYLARGTFGGHYMIFHDHVKICLLTSHRSPMDRLETAGFYRAFGEALGVVNECMRSLPVASAEPAVIMMRPDERKTGANREPHQMRLAPDA